MEALGALFLIAAFVVFLFFGEFGVILIGCVFGLLYLQPFKAHLASFKMFIYCFTMGALISTRLGKRVISFVPTASWPILLAAMLFAKGTIQETFATLLVGLIFYQKAGSLGTFLGRPISKFLGSISYSMYLFNVIFLEVIFFRTLQYQATLDYSLEFGLMVGVLIVLLTIPVAYLSMRLVEKPFIRFGKYLTSPKLVSGIGTLKPAQ